MWQPQSCLSCRTRFSCFIHKSVQLLFKRLIILGGSFNNNVPCKCPRITCRKLVSAIVLSKNAYLRAGSFRRRRISLNEWMNEWMNHMVRDYFNIFPSIHLKFQCVISEPPYFGRNTLVEIHQKRTLQGFNTRFEVRWFIDGSQSSEVVGWDVSNISSCCIRCWLFWHYPSIMLDHHHYHHALYFQNHSHRMNHSFVHSFINL